MANTQKNYNFNSVVLYDQAFDPKEDIIVSFLRSNEESEDLGFIKLQGGSVDSALLDLQSNTSDRLSLDITNVFDNLCIFLYDSRVPVLTGTSRSSCVSSFETQGIPGISWLSAGQTWYLAPSAYQAVYTSDAYHDNFSSDYYISGDGKRLIYPGVNRSDGPYGWAFQSLGDVVYRNFDVSGITGSGAGNFNSSSVGYYKIVGAQNGKNIYQANDDSDTQIRYRSDNKWELVSDVDGYYISVSTNDDNPWDVNEWENHPDGNGNSDQPVFSNFIGETGPTLISTVSATSGLQPWEVTEYFVPTNSIGPLSAGHTGNRTTDAGAPNGLSTYFTNPDTTINVQFSGFKSFGANEDGIERISLSAADPRDFQSPGCNLVNSNKRGVDVALASNFGISLSGLLAMAVIDNNGSFGLSGSQRFFYTGGTEFLSAGNFAVRTNSNVAAAEQSAGTAVTFDFKGSVITPTYPIVEDNWKLHRIGFRRHLQELILYQRDGSTYLPEHIFETGFDLSNLPPSVKIGFSYSGEMPMEIRNIAVNGTIVE